MGQRAFAAMRYEELYRQATITGRRGYTPEQIANGERETSADLHSSYDRRSTTQAGKAAGVSGRSMAQAKSVAEHAPDLADFVTAPPLKGLGATVELVRRVVSDDTEALSLLDAELQNPHGGDHKSEDFNVDNIHVENRPNGTSQDRALRKLRSDAPELHDEVLAGALSAHAAMAEPDFHPAHISLEALPHTRTRQHSISAHAPISRPYRRICGLTPTFGCTRVALADGRARRGGGAPLPGEWCCDLERPYPGGAVRRCWFGSGMAGRSGCVRSLSVGVSRRLVGGS